MDLQSPSLRAVSPTPFDTRSDHSRPSSIDSILADGNHLSFTAASPVSSITHISPRALFLTLTSPTREEDEEDSRPLSEFTRARRRDTVTYPSLGILPRVSSTSSSTHSPLGSTVYESFAPSTPSTSPGGDTHTEATHERESTAHALRFSSPERLLTPGQRPPRSTASWSDVASDSGDEPEFLVGSDVESWANVSDRAA